MRKRIYFQSSDYNDLTPREKTCLILASQDLSLIDTAKQMHVSPETVRKYRKTILRKFGCQTIVGALALAIKKNLLLI